MNMCGEKAFTLIELLIVVLIIAILAAIAVPNFLEAQTRSKVARAKADMRSLATALETYRMDNHDYPWVWQNPGYDLPRQLTTPIAYMTTLPKDPFGPTLTNDIYYAYMTTNDYYYATKKYFDFYGWNWEVYPGGSSNPAAWDLMSKGPDKAWARLPADGGVGVLEVDQPYTYEYDPTNGTISTGNIIRSGP
jgi:type II secretion system protein G